MAVADLDESRAQQAVGGSAARATTDAYAVLDDPDVAAVSIALPDHLHRELTVAALERGKHVFVEKPLATSLPDAKAMVAAATRADRLLQVNFSQRWLTDYSYIRGVIAAGEIGAVRSVTSTKRDTIQVPTEMIRWSASTSPVFFMTSHDLDLIRWFTGAEPTTVVAAVESRGVLEAAGYDVHDGVEALVEFTREAGSGEGERADTEPFSTFTVAFSTSWIHPATYPMVAEDRLEIVGTRGVLEYRSRNRQVAVHTSDTARTVEFSGPATATEVGGRITGAFTDSLNHFVDAVLTGSPSMTVGTDSLRAIACQDAILASAAAGGTRIALT